MTSPTDDETDSVEASEGDPGEGRDVVPEVDEVVEEFGEFGGVEPGDDDGAIEPSSRPVRFARNSAAGAVLNGVALGLKEVLEPEREEAPIIQVMPGEPPDPGWVDTEIDPLDPAASQVTVRPWHDDAE